MTGLARLIPSPRALLIFEAAARAGSASAAAREFNLTQPSVSRNIAALEAHLGTRLFERSPTGLALTDQGKLLQRALTEGLQKVEAAIEEIVALRRRMDVVELSLSTAFVTHWFIPRMPEFRQAFPSTDLRFQLISGSLRGGPGQVDLAMRMGSDSDDEHHAWSFAPELILPVCSPGYLAQRGTLENPIAGHTLLYLSDLTTDPQELWNAMGGAAPPRTMLEFSDYAVVMQAAMTGGGVAPGWITVASRALANRTLVPASRRRVRTGKEYRLLAPRSKPVSEVTHAIRAWMIAQMREEMEQLAPLLGGA